MICGYSIYKTVHIFNNICHFISKFLFLCPFDNFRKTIWKEHRVTSTDYCKLSDFCRFFPLYTSEILFQRQKIKRVLIVLLPVKFMSNPVLSLGKYPADTYYYCCHHSSATHRLAHAQLPFNRG